MSSGKTTNEEEKKHKGVQGVESKGEDYEDDINDDFFSDGKSTPSPVSACGDANFSRKGVKRRNTRWYRSTTTATTRPTTTTR
jgi:hypothetical protein